MSGVPALAALSAPVVTAAPGSTQVYLSWPAVTDAQGYPLQQCGYEIQQSASSSTGPWTQIVKASDWAGLNYRQFGLINGTTYYFRVRAATTAQGFGAWSTVVSAIPLTAPTAAPINLRAIASDSQIALSWNAVSGATFYNVWRKVGSNAYVIVKTVNATSWVDTGLTNDTTYDYAVNGGNGGGSANAFAYVSAAPVPPIPAVPTGLTSFARSSTSVYLSWNAVSNATGYSVLRSTTNGSNYQVVGSNYTNNFLDTSVAAHTTYYYVVAAKNYSATSGYSNQDSVTTLDYPTGLGAIPQYTNCFLAWNPVAGATSYVVKRSYFRPNGFGGYTTFNDTFTATNYYFLAPFPFSFEGQCSFSVQAVNSKANSDFSSQVRVNRAPYDSVLLPLGLSPTTVHGVDATTATVTLSNPAPSGGANVLLWSSTPLAVVPTSVTVPGGARSTTFTIPASAVVAQQTATFWAFYAGVTQTTTLTMAVNRAPVAVNDSATTIQNATVLIPVLTNDSDLDGDVLTPVSVVQGSKGTASINADKTISYVPTPNVSGSDSFSYLVSDGHGGTAMAFVAVTITPANRAPVANAQSVTTNEDTAKAIVLTATDADGDTIQYSIVSAPTKGTLSGTAPNLTYTPSLNANGSDSFTFKANDGQLDSNIATVSIAITPVNDAPIAVNDSANTTQGVAIDVAVLSNDSDVDGDNLTVTTVGVTSKGTVSINANNTVRYLPTAGMSGSDSFSYTISDGRGATASGIVTITIAAPTPPPTATPTPTATATPTATPSTNLTDLILAPTSVVGGNTSTGTVILASVAPAGGVVVTLVSNNPAAQVPVTVTVPAGSPSTQFNITTSTVTTTTTASISAIYGGVTQAKPLAITASTALPLAPNALASIAGNGQITLTWNSTVGASSYKIFRATSTGNYNFASPTVTLTNNFFTDTGLTNGTAYFYVLRASNVNGDSGNSNEATTTPLNQPLLITNISSGQVLSGQVVVGINAQRASVKLATILLKIDGILVGSSDPSGSTSTANFTSINFDTTRFSNGVHTIRVEDSAGFSNEVSATFQNAVSSISFTDVFDRNTGIIDVPHVCTIKATVSSTLQWTVKILDEDQNVFRSFPSGTGSINLSWDGVGDDTSKIGDGSYLLSISTSSLTSATSTLAAASTDPAPTVLDPIVGIINVDSYRDSLILISADAVDGPGLPDKALYTANRYANALLFAKKILTLVRNKVGVSLVSKPQALIVTPSDISSLAAGATPPIIARINAQFAARKVFIFVNAHGGWDVNDNSCFFAIPKNSKHWWYSKYSGTNPNVHDVSALVANLDYAGAVDNTSQTDPPKVVWMSHCDSAGSYYTGTSWTGYTKYTIPNPNDPDIGLPGNGKYANTSHSWATTFGIDPSNGYEGAFLGWSGHSFQATLTGNRWDRYMGDVLTSLFRANGSTNVGTALSYAGNSARTNGLPAFYIQDPDSAAANGSQILAQPEDRIRFWGTKSTAF